MKIISARLRNYRTIRDEAQIEVGSGLTLVGPNNVGKTNLMKGLRLFFTGYDNQLRYSRDLDLSFGQAKQQTNIALTFRIEDVDGEEVRNLLGQISSLLQLTAQVGNEFTVYLTFSTAGNPSYRVFPNSKRPTGANEKSQYSRFERALVDLILSKFSVHYIPSDKSTEQLYTDLVLPFLLRKAYQALSPNINLIQTAMNGAASSLNGSLAKAGLVNVEADFRFPDDPKRFFKEVDFSLSDPNATSIFNKGMGIQSAALLAAFNWITEEEVGDGKGVIWLLEEPESYLHPELASQCDRLIDELRGKSQVVCTTHSLAFVPQDPARILGVVLNGDGWTEVLRFKTYIDATDRIRKALGVKFSDFYNLDHFNILVEGESDRGYLDFFSQLLVRHSLAPAFPILTSGATSFLDQGGVSGLVGFVRAAYQFIRDERPCLVMLDGDSAGDKGRRELQQYLGNKQIPFQANQNFVIIRDRFAIEGLFPDEWILEIGSEHPGWFEDLSVDSAGSLLPFSVKSGSKKQFMQWMIAKATAETDLNWATRWISLLTALESGLRKEAIRIYGSEAEVAKILSFCTIAGDGESVEGLENLMRDPLLPNEDNFEEL